MEHPVYVRSKPFIPMALSIVNTCSVPITLLFANSKVIKCGNVNHPEINGNVYVGAMSQLTLPPGERSDGVMVPSYIMYNTGIISLNTAMAAVTVKTTAPYFTGGTGVPMNRYTDPALFNVRAAAFAPGNGKDNDSNVLTVWDVTNLPPSGSTLLNGVTNSSRACLINATTKFAVAVISALTCNFPGFGGNGPRGASPVLWMQNSNNVLSPYALPAKGPPFTPFVDLNKRFYLATNTSINTRTNIVSSYPTVVIGTQYTGPLASLPTNTIVTTPIPCIAVTPGTPAVTLYWEVTKQPNGSIVVFISDGGSTDVSAGSGIVSTDPIVMPSYGSGSGSGSSGSTPPYVPPAPPVPSKSSHSATKTVAIVVPVVVVLVAAGIVGFYMIHKKTATLSK